MLQTLLSPQQGVLLLEVMFPREADKADLRREPTVRAWAMGLGEEKRALRFELPKDVTFGQLMRATTQLAELNVKHNDKCDRLWEWRGNVGCDLESRMVYKSFWMKKKQPLPALENVYNDVEGRCEISL